MTNNTITGPKGFLAAGVRCGVKKSGKSDLGLIVCPTGAKAAAVFTTNKITSAAVEISKRHIQSATVYAVVVNSGNANCCSGEHGLKNAMTMCSKTMSAIAHLLCHEGRGTRDEGREILVASTGIIGKQLPIKNIADGIKKAVLKLSASASAGLDFAKAIMTTDTRPKQAIRQLTIE